MYCDKCGAELADNASFCSRCGNRIESSKQKNVYIALILSFFITGLGSVYAGNIKKGLVLFSTRLLLIVIGLFINIFIIFSIFIWAYAFYEAYRDVQIANGQNNPKLIDDFKGWDQNTQIIAILIVVILLIFVVFSSINMLSVNEYSSGNSNTYHHSSSGGSGVSSSSPHYGGVDDSPNTIAKNDPDWYYDHYEYGDNPDIDDYLESEGYD